MKKYNLFLFILLLPILIFSQNDNFTRSETGQGDIKIPGEWTEFRRYNDSGQIFFTNDDKVVIAIAKQKQKFFSFYNGKNSNYENVVDFYKWDSNYFKKQNFKTKKLKENPKLEYIIWKYNEDGIDNVFLFGASNDLFLNLLVYTNLWDEEKKIKFLEELYEINK